MLISWESRSKTGSKRLQTTTNAYHPTICATVAYYCKKSNPMNNRNGYKSLIIYQKTFQFAMSIFHMTKKFPDEERYGLTSQIRRSSRSVCANIVEGYRNRVY